MIVKEIFVADIQKDDSIGPLQMLVGDLPDAGQHAERTIAFGPDGMLYISAGSTRNSMSATLSYGRPPFGRPARSLPSTPRSLPDRFARRSCCLDC